jgi:hypothetical protein
MLLELKRLFDVIDPSGRFEDYRLLILPDQIPVSGELAARLGNYVEQGGRILFTGQSGFDENGQLMLKAGIERVGPSIAFDPSYMRASKGLDGQVPDTPFVMYGVAETVASRGAEVLAEVVRPYFNRTFGHFSSHQHTPDDPLAEALGVAVTLHGNVAYVAYPIFTMYQAMGQPLYKYVVRGLIDRLLPESMLTTDLPSAGRATLTRQGNHRRHILHLLYGPPQVRGKRVPSGDGTTRLMEMIEDIPAVGPVTARVRLAHPPARVHEALTGTDIAWTHDGDGVVQVTLPRLHIHSALVFEGTA